MRLSGVGNFGKKSPKPLRGLKVDLSFLLSAYAS